MKFTWLHILLVGWFGYLSTAAYGQQHYVRADDHFWRQRVVQRIVLIEKINAPLVYHESSFYDDKSQFPETNGMIVSLINGVKAGHYPAYHPDEDYPMQYDKLHERIKEFEQALYGDDGWDSVATEPVFEDEFAYPEDSEEWAFDEWEEPEDGVEEIEMPAETAPAELDLSAYEQVIHLVEDWIFDKMSSQMIQEIRFLEIIWTDPSGTLPEKVLCRLKWEDIQEQLDRTQWKNRYNDVETRSIKDVFALRLFNGIMINVGGKPVRSVYEAERRRQEIVEFEHHLWSY